MKNRKANTVLVIVIAVFAAPILAAGQSSVKMYEKPLTLTTYKVEEADRNPIFYTDRAYQGAKGEVYPYPLQNNLTDEKVRKEWKGLFLENEYIEICVLPEIGGKLWYARDKSNDYNFVYYNEQVKPALIGMLGAWTSGGIEWNIPHHHRASTYMNIDYELEEHPDGSKTIWVGEIERRHRTKWRVGYTLHPGKAYVETKIKLYNRTPIEQSFLIFANTAVHANENYQVIFPPATQYGTYHSKTHFTEWPISNQHYAGVDFTEGVDVSMWKNHPEPVSIFDWGNGNFLAGYDHGKESGTLVVGNPHIMIGRKFFEWGPGPRGSMWDDILTDSSGPYLELMTGAFSDNQPDYSWVHPTMMKSATMYFSPLRNIGGVKKATKEAALNLERDSNNRVNVGVYVTGIYESALVTLSRGRQTLQEKQVDLTPSQPFTATWSDFGANQIRDLRLSLLTSNGDTLLTYQPVRKEKKPMPEPVTPPKSPREIETVEKLYREGLRLEQFYNPTLEPMPYYREALDRDPNHSLVNTQVGIYYLKRHRFEEAEHHLRTAVKTVTQDYTAPKNAESLYYLGLALARQGEQGRAYDWFYKATWDFAWHAPAYYQLAKIDAAEGRFKKALEHLERSLSTNTLHKNALNLKSAVLRKLDEPGQAITTAQRVLDEDPLNAWALNELYRAGQAANRSAGESTLQKLTHQMRDDVQSYLELATDYGNAGLYSEAIMVLRRAADSEVKELRTYPMVSYYLGYYNEQMGNRDKAGEWYAAAGKQPSDYCFPYRFESIDVLKAALARVPDDAKAHYYLGNLFYDHMPEQAISHWKESVRLDDSFPIVHRNLAFAYAHIRNDNDRAITYMETALALNPDDSRYYAELDRYYEIGGISPEKRLETLEGNHEIVKRDDTALAREIRLLIFHGRYTEALELLENHHFRKIEGVGNIHNQWVDAHLLRGRERMEEGAYEEALSDFEQALRYPRNLEVGGGNRDGQVYYFMARAYEAMGQSGRAQKYYRQTTEVNYGWNEMRYRQGLAYEKLGNKQKAREIFTGLIQHGNEMLADDSGADFFEKFSADENEKAHKANAHYLIGLGKLGLDEDETAQRAFEKALDLNPAHLGAKVLL